MASGVVVGTKYDGGHYWIELHWSSDTDSISIDTYFCSDYSAYFSSTKDGSTTADGSTHNWSDGTNVSHSGGSTQKTFIHTETFTPNSTEFSISGWYEPNINIGSYGTLGRMNASGSAKLDGGTCWMKDGSGWHRMKVWINDGSWHRVKQVWMKDSDGWHKMH